MHQKDAQMHFKKMSVYCVISLKPLIRLLTYMFDVISFNLFVCSFVCLFVCISVSIVLLDRIKSVNIEVHVDIHSLTGCVDLPVYSAKCIHHYRLYIVHVQPPISVIF